MAKRERLKSEMTATEEAYLFEEHYRRRVLFHLAEEDKIKEPDCDVRCMPTGYRRTKLSCKTCKGFSKL